MIPRILLVLVIIGVLVGVLLYSQSRPQSDHVSGFIEADEIRVASRVGGRVAKTLAREGERVKRGDPLIELEPYDLLHRQAEAKAKRDELAAKLAKLKAGPRRQEIAAAQARVDAAAASTQLARITYERVKSSSESRATSATELDQADAELKNATAQENARRQDLDELKEGTRPEEIAEAEAAVAAADAALAQIGEQIKELRIVSPVDGIVEALDIQPGDMVAANAPVLSLLDTSNIWVRAYIPENRMDVKPDDKVTITVDSFPGKTFIGHISFIARQAEFTPNNVQTPEERSKQVFRIKATLDEGLDVLRPGMAADVRTN
ncbi:MAG: efflux RND transporter periplasmic adaptor subunit [Anaerolineae bacterium]|nr:efflux RND transporter periplasmic adaptor subunit [Phycisphaerae bacterium]